MLGIVSGALGAFACLRKQSLMGDAISHAALPGVVLAFMLTGLKAPLVLMTGAAIAGIAGVLLVVLLTRATRIKQDSSLGIILSVFFGFGLMLLDLSAEQSRRTAGRSQPLSLWPGGHAARPRCDRDGDLWWLRRWPLPCCSGRSSSCSALTATSAPVWACPCRLEILITLLLVVAIVIGLQAVGVVLMSAMIVAPAAAARQWTDRLGVMVLLSRFLARWPG